jgi:hypothetical protein
MLDDFATGRTPVSDLVQHARCLFLFSVAIDAYNACHGFLLLAVCCV